MMEEICVEKETLLDEIENLKQQVQERDEILIEYEKKILKLEIETSIKENEARMSQEGMTRTLTEEQVQKPVTRLIQILHKALLVNEVKQKLRKE
jgi:hypothetical protein